MNSCLRYPACIYFQLAADAGNPIAMTDDEKQRVESLLADLNSLTDIPEDEVTQVHLNTISQ